MINKIRILGMVAAILTATNLAAQNKVVVVPLGGDDQKTGGASSYTDAAVSVFDGQTETVQTRTVSLPKPGNLMVFASWQFGYNPGETGECAVTLNSSAFSNTFSNGSDPDHSEGFIEDAMAVTGFFTGVSEGINTVRLVCQAPSGAITVRKRSLSVIYLEDNIELNL